MYVHTFMTLQKHTVLHNTCNDTKKNTEQFNALIQTLCIYKQIKLSFLSKTNIQNHNNPTDNTVLPETSAVTWYSKNLLNFIEIFSSSPCSQNFITMYKTTQHPSLSCTTKNNQNSLVLFNAHFNIILPSTHTYKQVF